MSAKAPKAAPAKDEKPQSLLDGIAIEDILFPKAYIHTMISPQTGSEISVPIKPMEDWQLAVVGDSIEYIVMLLQNELSAGNFDVGSLISMIPTVVKNAIPQVTKIIAVSFGWEADKVAKFRLAEKVSLLEGILRAEDTELILKNVRGLGSMFSGIPTNQALTAEAENQDDGAIDMDLIEAMSTRSLRPSSDGQSKESPA